MILYTAQIGYVGSSQQVVIDTTVKSSRGSAAVLAPTWELVMGHKRGQISWEQYTNGYLSLMRRRYLLPYQKQRILDFLHLEEEVVFTCYCSQDRYPMCHRWLLVDIFNKIAQREGVNFAYEGELGKGNPHSHVHGSTADSV